MIINKSLMLSKAEQKSFLSRLYESYKDFPEDQKPLIAQMNLTADVEMVQCAFGEVPKGSPLSYQFPVPSAKDFMVHDDAPPQPELPLFSCILEQASNIPTLSAMDQYHLNNMHVSWEEAHNLERSTRGCKESDKKLEKMRLISRFKEISKLKPGQSNAEKLVLKIRHGKPKTFKILSGQGGPEHLKLEATREYCRNLCVNLFSCGLVIPPYAPWMGAFPDGVVYDPTEKNIFGLLHTKYVEDSYMECSFLACREYGIQLKKSDQHYWHIQGELMVTGMTWCDLLVHSTNDMLVQRIYRDETTIKCLKSKLEEFFYYYYLPKLNYQR
uniref:Si:ch211-166e11.5 n=2 Tax=Iconisemion striatum TaxID=60296 RepID=A0A1A7XAV4_9TELE